MATVRNQVSKQAGLLAQQHAPSVSGPPLLQLAPCLSCSAFFPYLSDNLAFCADPTTAPATRTSCWVESASACQEACVENPCCRHLTYNYAGSKGHYPGGCFLFASCGLRHPGDGQWISVTRTCKLSDSYHLSPPYNLLDSAI